MRFYNRTEDDKLSCINRCYFEADNGNLYDSLERINDVEEEFPNDPKVFFVEGSLRRDFLGQGIKSRELFKKAYNLDNNHLMALTNIINLSSDENEYRKYAEILLKSTFNYDNVAELRKSVQYTLNDFNSGLNHFNWLLEMSNLEFNEQSYGLSASHIEIALSNWDYSYEIDPVRLRRMRAEALRMIDKDSDAKKVYMV